MLLNCEYIGINPNCSKQQRRSALAHELGHAIFDRKHAAFRSGFPRYIFL
ncbi:MAG: ImmA/IrrE family metallo-endopeptidase [Clostridium sp.]